MVPDWLARAVAARQAPAAGVALLALAMFGQGLAQVLAASGPPGQPAANAAQDVLYAVALCLLALAATVPLLLLRPTAAAAAVTAANLLLAGFGMATVAGVIAQLIAAYRAGAAGEPRPLRGAGGAGGASWAIARAGSAADADSAADEGSVTGVAGLASADVVSAGGWPDWLRRVPGARQANGPGSVASPGSVTGADMASAGGWADWLRRLPGARQASAPGSAGGADVVSIGSWAGWLRRVPGARRVADLGPAVAQYLGVVLAVPFLILALVGRGGDAAVVLAWGGSAAAATGIAVRARREARTRTAAGEALADTMLAHTARGERARIARELHDVVAHHISMVAVQAETARLTTPGLPAAGAQRFADIGDTARAGLTEMRRLLGVLREDAAEAGATVADRHPQPGLPQLAELVDVARDASGAAARLIVSGPVAEFDPGVELAAYRIVQEALTNARRHAPGAAVDVELRYADDALRLLVRDNGPGPAGAPGVPGAPDGGGAEAPAGGGHGLLGMRERAIAVGGSLHTGAAPGGGFLVEAVLPAKPEVS
jgi:signal transduction histidine kinase